jgi:hypothetical protein
MQNVRTNIPRKNLGSLGPYNSSSKVIVSLLFDTTIKRIKSYTRNTIGQDRLNNMAAIEKDLVNNDSEQFLEDVPNRSLCSTKKSENTPVYKNFNQYFFLTLETVVLVHNGHKRDIRHKKS